MELVGRFFCRIIKLDILRTTKGDRKMLKKISFFIVSIIFTLTYIVTLPIEANEQKLARAQNSEGDFRELLEKRKSEYFEKKTKQGQNVSVQSTSLEFPAKEFLNKLVNALQQNNSTQVKSLLTIANIKELIERGENINVKHDKGFTLLMIAASESDNPEITKLLLNAGADVNAKDKQGVTALMKALKNGKPEIIKILLNSGAKVNDKEKESGVTPLMIAAHSNSPEVIKMLLDAGANVNDSENDHGLTPLMIAAMNNTNPEVIKILLQAGADINAKLKTYGATARDLAKGNKNPEVLRILDNQSSQEAKKTKEESNDKKSNEKSCISKIFSYIVAIIFFIIILSFLGKLFINYFGAFFGGILILIMIYKILEELFGF